MHTSAWLLLFLAFSSATNNNQESGIPVELTQPYLETLFEHAHKNPRRTSDDWLSRIDNDISAGRRESLVKTALDLGLDLEFLAKYGLEKHENGSYSANLGDHPQWITMADIARSVTSRGYLATNSESLLDRGIPKSDLDILLEHSESNSYMSVKFTAMLSFLSEAEKYIELIRGPGDHEQLFTKLLLLSNQIQADYEQEWAFNLLNRLTKRTRMILLEEALSIQKIKKFSNEGLSHQEKKHALFRSITSEKIKKQLHQQLNHLNGRTNNDD
ncbi:hypothetical protein [Microbulbifer sediminum]|uniref:hypothetical protein n=1 Tax=Microbulbifer sediminum TaxID=2904250 RepID=UPI001F41A3D4|nr:hypothetical protein [Microbulbifer sediminum]